MLYIPVNNIFTSPRQSISLEVCVGILDYYGYYLVFCHHRIPIDIKPKKNPKQYECEEDEYQGDRGLFRQGGRLTSQQPTYKLSTTTLLHMSIMPPRGDTAKVHHFQTTIMALCARFCRCIEASRIYIFIAAEVTLPRQRKPRTGSGVHEILIENSATTSGLLRQSSCA